MVDVEHKPRPAPPAWLDKDLIQRALRSKDDPTITVTSCEISMANAEGDGYLSNMYRVIAQVQGSQERRVIVKCEPLGGNREALIGSLDAYNKEIRMLSRTLPAMHQLLEQACPGQYQPFCARYLYHGDDPVHYIVMEDLKQSGFSLANRQKGLDLNHCLLVIRTLARFHASSLALYDKNPEEVKCFKCPVHEESRELESSFYENAVRSIAKEAAKWPGYEKIVSKLNKLVDSIFDRVMKCFERNDEEFNVLCHGDPWTNNMMFKYSNGVIEDVRFVDFQICYFTSPGTDLHYFLHSVPSEDVRINHLDSLLKEYHSVLTETLIALGCSKYVISLEQLQKIFKDYYFYGFLSSTTVMPIAISEPGTNLDVEEALGGDGDTNNIKMYQNKVYVEAMKRLLLFFDKEHLLD